MKKLIVSAALACAATFAHAAAVDWSASAVYDAVATAAAGKNTPAKGWVGYVILASDYDAVTTDLVAGKTDSLVAKHVGPVKTTTNQGKFAYGTPSGNVASGEQSFYLIILNSADAASATGYAVSAKKDASIDAALDSLIEFGSAADYTKSTSSWASIGGGSGEDPVAPEPTSGVLLAIGAAMLGLRRKRA